MGVCTKFARMSDSTKTSRRPLLDRQEKRDLYVLLVNLLIVAAIGAAAARWIP